MNLQAIANAAIQGVNPNVPATLQISTGYVVNADLSTTPTYSTQAVSAQVQPLSGRDLRQVDGMNLNGTLRKIYITGILNATVRVSGKGGDLVTLSDGPNAGTWLVSQVLEQFEDWVSVAATLQNGG